jgi:hypothetical protein
VTSHEVRSIRLIATVIIPSRLLSGALWNPHFERLRRSKAGGGLHLQLWRTLTPMTMTIVPIIRFRLKSVFVVALYPVLEELDFGRLDSNTATSRLQTRVLYP